MLDWNKKCSNTKRSSGISGHKFNYEVYEILQRNLFQLNFQPSFADSTDVDGSNKHLDFWCLHKTEYWLSEVPQIQRPPCISWQIRTQIWTNICNWPVSAGWTKTVGRNHLCPKIFSGRSSLEARLALWLHLWLISGANASAGADDHYTSDFLEFLDCFEVNLLFTEQKYPHKPIWGRKKKKKLYHQDLDSINL